MHEKRNHTHLRNLLQQKIREAGGNCEASIILDGDVQNIDVVVTQIKQDQYIFKITTQNHPDIQDGIAQLYEYRYLQNLPDSILVLVIEKALPSRVSWMHQYLEQDRQIRLVWDGDNQLHASPQTQRELAFLW